MKNRKKLGVLLSFISAFLVMGAVIFVSRNVDIKSFGVKATLKDYSIIFSRSKSIIEEGSWTNMDNYVASSKLEESGYKVLASVSNAKMMMGSDFARFSQEENQSIVFSIDSSSGIANFENIKSVDIVYEQVLILLRY